MTVRLIGSFFGPSTESRSMGTFKILIVGASGYPTPAKNHSIGKSSKSSQFLRGRQVTTPEYKITFQLCRWYQHSKRPKKPDAKFGKTFCITNNMCVCNVSSLPIYIFAPSDDEQICIWKMTSQMPTNQAIHIVNNDVVIKFLQNRNVKTLCLRACLVEHTDTKKYAIRGFNLAATFITHTFDKIQIL